MATATTAETSSVHFSTATDAISATAESATTTSRAATATAANAEFIQENLLNHLYHRRLDDFLIFYNGSSRGVGWGWGQNMIYSFNVKYVKCFEQFIPTFPHLCATGLYIYIYLPKASYEGYKVVTSLCLEMRDLTTQIGQNFMSIHAQE